MKPYQVKYFILISCLFLAIYCPQVSGGDVWWDVCNGNWSDAANWMPKIPTSTDTVYIDNGCGGPSITKGDSFADTIYLGMDTTGNTLSQSGVLPNSLTISKDLYLGMAAGSEGKYSLSGVGKFSVGRYTYVGVYGNGTFKQSGGTTTFNSYFLLGDSPGTVGVYEMTGGEADFRGYVYFGRYLYDAPGDPTRVGMGGTGIFKHSGGKVKMAVLNLLAGKGSRYELSGTGELTVSPNYEYINGMWADKPNRFIQSGGKHTTPSIKILSQVPDGAADYTLTNGTLLVTAYGTGIDVQGSAAKFIQSGGTNSVTYDVQIQGGAKYELSGTGSVSMSNLTLGSSVGPGQFIQISGTTHLFGNLVLGPSSSCWGDEFGSHHDFGDGHYELKNGELSVGVLEAIGGYGSSSPCSDSISTFIQSGGVHQVGTWLYIGYDPTVTGKYDLSSGELEANILWLGYKGNGEFNQTGGRVGAGRLDIGRDPGSYGDYKLDQTGQLIVDKWLTVGRSGVGVMEIKGGKVATKSFSIGRYVGQGTLSLAPASEVIVTQELVLGSKAEFGAEPGSGIFLGFDTETNTPANFQNLSKDPYKLSGLANLDLSFEGGVDQAATMEIAGSNSGAEEIGFLDNFALGVLRVGTDSSPAQVKLVDDTDNGTGGPGSEVLYVDRIVLTQGSILDLNGKKAYYHTLCDSGGTINLNGGFLVQVGIPGDLDHNGNVDINDLTGFIAKWLWKGLEGSIPEDLACGGDVNLLDFSVLASNWLEQ